MRKVKIVVDSSSNLYNDDIISTVPLTLTLGEEVFVDNDEINVNDFMEKMEAYKGKTTSACPSSALFMEEFEGADEVYSIAITSKLSGCYNALVLAKNLYEEDNEDAKILTIDSLSTGPEMVLIAEKIKELVDENYSFEEISTLIKEYQKKTHLVFMLKSLDNLAKNGRVNIAIAKAIKLLKFCIIGCASDEGTLSPVGKARGERKAIGELYEAMKKRGYNGGKVRISHTANMESATALRDLIIKDYPNANILIIRNKALCTYYAERGGILVGFDE